MFENRRRLTYCACILLIIISVYFTQGKVLAEDTGKLSIPFTVSPVMPENQRPGVLGYFDLLTGKGLKQTIHVKLRNDSGKPLVVDISPANALTALNGGIQYTAEEGSDAAGFIDKSFAIKSQIAVQAKAEAAIGETVDIPVTVTIPDRDSGTYLGGLLFTAEGEGEGGQVNQGGGNTSFSLKNRVAVAIAIQLDLPEEEAPALSFGDVGIQSIPSGAQLYIGIANDSPAIIKEAEGNYEVLKGSAVVMKGKFGPFNMAPETKINYPVFWNNDLVPGEYKVKLDAIYGGQNISEEKSFTIGPKEQNQYHDITGRNPIPNAVPWWVWVCGGAAFLLITAFVYILGRRQGSKSKNKQ